MPFRSATQSGQDHQLTILTDLATRSVYSTDNSIYQLEPGAVAVPANADQIADLLADNYASPSRKPVVARGAGTGTNGQSLTNGVMIDVKRHLNQILDVDVEAQTVTVQPGVVAAKLNSEVAKHGMFWAPHASTLNRATVGGMISTDAAGKGSLVYGRTNRHVLSLNVILNDGTRWTAAPTTVAKAKERAKVDDRIGRLWQALLALPVSADSSIDLPSLARGFSGYGVDRLRYHTDHGTSEENEIINPIPLLAGSEGTLAVITEAKLRLTPIPEHTVLVVAGYSTFAEALDDAVELAATGPTAIECFDQTTLERGRSSVAWPALGRIVDDQTGSVLLLEYTGDTMPEASEVLAQLDAIGRRTHHAVVADPADRSAIWKVRADAVGLLAKVAVGSGPSNYGDDNPKGGDETVARPTAFVEDCAVPVDEMSAFIAGFRELLDSHGLDYAMFGHADVGCVHVRPALDLTSPAHHQMVTTITNEVIDLVARHGGILWGEHGRGFRGSSSERFLSPEVIAIMRSVKEAFDPEDVLNPGKLYRPASSHQPLIGLDEPPVRGQHNRLVAVDDRRHFADAFACNGNGLCHHYDPGQVMCPSYKATGDPALSPKGRADLVRAWLAARANNENARQTEISDSLVDNFDQCLSCSACTGHCPIEVDIPEVKSRFLAQHYDQPGRRRPWTHHVMARFETVAALVAKVPAFALKPAAPIIGRVLGLVDLPVPCGGSVSATERDDHNDVVVMADVFTSVLEPSVGHAAVAVLERLGYSVGFTKLVGSGKYDHVKGMRTRFVKAAGRQAQAVADIVDGGAVPVVIEPAVGLLHSHEYVAAYPGYPAEAVKPVVSLIMDRIDRLTPVSDQQSVVLLGHCTERANAADWLGQWATVLVAAGFDVLVPDVGCCGMAGVFGHEQSNQELAQGIYRLSWGPTIDGLDGAIPVATGYSCRSQAKRFGDVKVLHPLELLHSNG